MSVKVPSLFRCRNPSTSKMFRMKSPFASPFTIPIRALASGMVDGGGSDSTFWVEQMMLKEEKMKKRMYM